MPAKPWTQEELTYLINHYAVMGPKSIGLVLERPMKQVSKKAMKMGLWRGAKAARQLTRNKWQFENWSYELGYILGVYLGDGNVWITKSGGYFRLNVIDEDFALATKHALEKVSGYSATIHKYPARTERNQEQFCVRLCNMDFIEWLVGCCGKAKQKRIPVLTDLDAIKGLLEGFSDSEGTMTDTSIMIRAYMDLEPLSTMMWQLDINRLYKWGVRDGRVKVNQSHLYSENLGEHMRGISVSTREWSRAGLGTYIARKAKNIPFKSFCYDQDGKPRE